MDDIPCLVASLGNDQGIRTEFSFIFFECENVYLVKDVYINQDNVGPETVATVILTDDDQADSVFQSL